MAHAGQQQRVERGVPNMKATPEPAASSTPRIFIGLTFSLTTHTSPQKRQRRKGKGEQAEARTP